MTRGMRMRDGEGRNHPNVGGNVTAGFEPVRDAFVDNFAHRGELGGAVCVVVAGEVVVDLWGGVRVQASGAPWSADTMTLVHSTTKGLSAMVLALLHSRGQLDYDERVATYWPEFAQAGKQDITARQLLAHQAGLFAFDEQVDRDVVADLDHLARVMERQRPIWPPGERQAYHAISLGFYENELVRRIDPGRRTIGRMFNEDIATPLGVGDEVYIGTPSRVSDERLAALIPPGLWARLTSMPLSFTVDAMRRSSVLHRSLVANPGTSFYVDPASSSESSRCPPDQSSPSRTSHDPKSAVSFIRVLAMGSIRRVSALPPEVVSVPSLLIRCR